MIHFMIKKKNSWALDFSTLKNEEESLFIIIYFLWDRSHCK